MPYAVGRLLNLTLERFVRFLEDGLCSCGDPEAFVGYQMSTVAARVLARVSDDPADNTSLWGMCFRAGVASEVELVL